MTEALVWTFAAALVLAAGIYLFERWRLARPGGPYAASDFTGVVTLLALMVGWAVYLPSGPSIDIQALRWLWIGGLVVFVVGAVTDQLRPTRGLRAISAFIAAWLLYRAGITIETVKLPFSARFVELGVWGLVVSTIWLALSGSLFARAGTIPRVSVGVGALTAFTFAVIGLMEPQTVGLEARFISLSVALVCVAQLPFTRYLTCGAATAGSYLLGVVIGAVAIAGALKNTAFLVALLPLLVVGVPLFAAVYSWLANVLVGRGDGVIGRRNPHLYDILLEQGYSRLQTAVVLLVGTGILCLTAIVLVALIEITFVVKTLVLVAGLVAALFIPYVLLRLLQPVNPPAPEDAYELFGVRVDRVTMDSAMEMVRGFITDGSPHIIVTTDAGGIIRAQDDDRMRQIMNGADLVTADGAGVVLAARLLNLGIHTRVAGCDMVWEICRVATEMGRSVYLLGAAPGVAEKAAEKLKEQIPGLRIAGIHHGYFDDEQEPQIIADIRNSSPGVLFVALGAPRQEKWIMRHVDELGVPVAIGIGGSLDVISGLKQRAPVWMQRCGLEWLYRTAKEPSRFSRLSALPRIMWLTLCQLLRAPTERDARPVSQTHADDATKQV